MSFPVTSSKVRVQISDLSRTIMHLMLGFCLYSQKTKGLVHIVIAYILLMIDSYKSRHPAVAMGRMGLMDLRN